MYIAMSNKLKAASTSIIINILLLISKILLAVFTGSIALIAESAHSLFDLVASVLAFIGIKMAEQPDDEAHHFGHEKYETLSSLLQALLITGTAFVIIFEAYQKFTNPTPVHNSEWGILLMVISIPVTFLTAKYLSDTAKKEGGSQALEADSAHFTTDVIGSVAVLIGLILVRFGLPFGDPLAALAVGLIMLYISFQISRDAFLVFMDYSPSKDKIKRIKNVLDSEVEKKRITRYHKLRARMAGSKILLEFHIHVRKDLDIVQAHNIASEIKKDIKAKVPELKEATIHIEPD